MRYHMFILIVLLMFTTSCSLQPVKIACVGDSITEGSGNKIKATSAYPIILKELLEPYFLVLNCGRGGTTTLKTGDFSYWDCKEFTNVFMYKPNIITIKLGTNDTKPHNWNAEKFTEDYQSLIDTFKTISPCPEIYLCLPVPVFRTLVGINDSTLKSEIIPIIKEIADVNGLPVIDLNASLKDYGAHFPDGVHPDNSGAWRIAEVIS